MNQSEREFLAFIQDEIEYCSKHILYFIENYIVIKSKATEEAYTQFKLWPEQKRVVGEFTRNRLNIVLKARQLGLSWLAVAYAFFHMLFRPGYDVIIISRTDSEGKEMIERIGVMLKFMPSWWLPERKNGPSKYTGLYYEITSHTAQIVFPDGKISRMIAMPTSEDPGRSFSADLLILDEWASQRWADQIWKAAYPTVSHPTAGKVFGISTIKNGTLFANLYEDAEEFGFNRIFLPWYAHPGRDREWYEAQVRAMGEHAVRSEYPATEEEAFGAAGDRALPMWDPDIHVIEPFDIPDSWPRWISVDNGLNEPYAWYWYAVGPDETVYVYREYARDPRQPYKHYTDQAKDVRDLMARFNEETGEFEYEHIGFIVAGLDAWATDKRYRTGKCIVDFYREGGLGRYAFVKPETDRKLRLAAVREYLKIRFVETVDDEGNTIKVRTTKLRVFNTCAYLIGSLPRLPVDDKDHDKVSDNRNVDNHGYDSLSYGLVIRHVNRASDDVYRTGEVGRLKEDVLRRKREFEREQRLLY
jgi:hypothetical protein